MSPSHKLWMSSYAFSLSEGRVMQFVMHLEFPSVMEVR